VAEPRRRAPRPAAPAPIAAPARTDPAALVGSEGPRARLRAAVAAGRVAHAYAFTGPDAEALRAVALEFAAALVAPAGGAAAARVARGAHPDVHVFAPTPPDSNPKGVLALRMESIRELERLASLRPHESEWKVFIVEGADRMTVNAPQTFLKTLEEPPARTVIVLLAANLRVLPATVLSRCQIVRFPPATAPGAPALLPDAGDEARARDLEWVRAAASGATDAIVRCGDAVQRDRPAAERLIETCWLWYRDVLVTQAGAGRVPTVFASRAEALAADGARRRPEELLEGLRAIREAWQALQGNVAPRLTVEVLLGRLAARAA